MGFLFKMALLAFSMGQNCVNEDFLQFLCEIPCECTIHCWVWMPMVSFLNHVLLVLPGVGTKLTCSVFCGKNVRPYCNAHWTIDRQLASQLEGYNETQQTWACSTLNSWCIIINIINMNGVEPHRYPLVQNQKKQNQNASWNVSQICEGLSSGKDPANHLELECWASSWVYNSLFLRALCSVTS